MSDHRDCLATALEDAKRTVTRLQEALKMLDEPAPDLWLWSDWIDWHGGECPLPPDVLVKAVLRSGGPPSRDAIRGAQYWIWRHVGTNNDITRFRYLADEPGGWIKYPTGWAVPQGSGLQYEPGCQWGDRIEPAAPGEITSHMRLFPREKKAEPLPEWAEHVGDDRYNVRSCSRPWLGQAEFTRNDIARIAELHRILKARGD